MSALHRWSTPCLLLALLTYLTMAGLADLHTHGHIRKPSRQHHTPVAVSDLTEVACPLCVWQAITTASCRLVLPWLIFPTIMPLAPVVSLHEAQEAVATIHARAPPLHRQCSSVSPVHTLPDQWRNS